MRERVQRHFYCDRSIVSLRAFGYQVDWMPKPWEPFSVRQGWQKPWYHTLVLGRLGQFRCGRLRKAWLP